MRQVWTLARMGALSAAGLLFLACNGGSNAGGGKPAPDANRESIPEGDSGLLPGCAEYCRQRVTACGTSEIACLTVCSRVNREKKEQCVREHEALYLCYAAHVPCDGGAPDECLAEIGRASSCFETNGYDSSGCVQTFGGGTCKGDFVDGRSAQRTCYPRVPIPPGCISISEILALRGFAGEGPPATHTDGTLIESAVVCCPP